MPAGVELIGYADDILIVVSRRDISDLKKAAAQAVGRVAAWLEATGLEVAGEKTAAVWLSRRRAGRVPGEKFGLLGHEIEATRSMRYLGVVIEANPLSSSQVAEAAASAGRAASSIARLLANTGGPSEATRRLLMGAAAARLLYAAPVWAACTGSQRNRDRLCSALRPASLRVARCYKTVSTVAVQVLASTAPPDLLVEMRGRVYSRVAGGTDRLVAKREGRGWLAEQWQARWAGSTKGSWTRRLIPEVQAWVERRHGETDYFLGQLLSGHGEFEEYLRKIGKANSARCPYCRSGEDDTAEHTLASCSAWTLEREGLRTKLGEVNPATLVGHMLTSQPNWDAVGGFARAVLTRKEVWKREGR